MKQSDPWRNLVAAARLHTDGRDESAPYGFSTRVAALGLAAKPARASILDPFSLRVSLQALGVAALLAVVSTGVSYSALSRAFAFPASPAPALSSATPAAGPAAAPSTEAPASATAPSDDPVAELVDIVS
jgi:hypothetical protein